jgi:Ca2+-binding RTX toxin-like protein
MESRARFRASTLVLLILLASLLPSIASGQDEGAIVSTIIVEGPTAWHSSVEIGPDGSVYVMGMYGSADRLKHQRKGYQSPTSGQEEIFVARIDPTGAFVYLVTLGGDNSDIAGGLAVGPDGGAYVAGFTMSGEFPVTPGFLTDEPKNPYGRNAFLTKISPDGSRLDYSGFIRGGDSSYDVAVDHDGAAYLVGNANRAFEASKDLFPTSKVAGGGEGFLAKISPSGSHFVYSTLVGGSEYDEAYLVEVDGVGQAYVGGHTTSVDFRVSSDAPDKELGGGSDAYAAKISSDGDRVLYSTFHGKDAFGEERANGLAVDARGRLYISGNLYRQGEIPITEDAFDPVRGNNYEGYLTILSPEGDNYEHSTYLGHEGPDGASPVTFDRFGNLYVALNNYREVGNDAHFDTTILRFDREMRLTRRAEISDYSTSGLATDEAGTLYAAQDLSPALARQQRYASGQDRIRAHSALRGTANKKSQRLGVTRRIIACTIKGTPGKDTLNGTRRGDVICGRGGRDVIRGGGGADVIILGPGRDSATGGRGLDVLVGGTGRDRLSGGSARDRLVGGGGGDTLLGREGGDSLLGGSSNDVLKGGSGRDSLSAAGGRDRLFGMGDGDVLRGGSGRDLLAGGPGADRCRSGAQDRRRSCERD